MRALQARLLMVLAGAGCSTPAPRAIATGAEPCAHCHMTIADTRYAGELVLRTGKVEVFDDISCLAAFLREGAVAAERVHSRWVRPVTGEDRWIPAEQAFYLQREGQTTPMASGLLAFATARQADSARAEAGGVRLAWDDIMALPPGSLHPHS